MSSKEQLKTNMVELGFLKRKLRESSYDEKGEAIFSRREVELLLSIVSAPPMKRPAPEPTPTQQLSRIVELCEELDQEGWVECIGYEKQSNGYFYCNIYCVDEDFSYEMCPTNNVDAFSRVITDLETALDKGSFE